VALQVALQWPRTCGESEVSPGKSVAAKLCNPAGHRPEAPFIDQYLRLDTVDARGSILVLPIRVSSCSGTHHVRFQRNHVPHACFSQMNCYARSHYHTANDEHL
jgi:hypothetical protein